MFRHFAVVIGLCACAAEDPSEELGSVAQHASFAFQREHVVDDIYHYELVLPVGSEPNAAVRVHRVVRELAPFVPRPSPHAVMMLHGDFATFETNFAPTLGQPASPAPGLAPYLAAQGIDVWGTDRRWTLPAPEDDVSDFATMGLAQELDDLRVALSVARAVRLAGGSGGGKLALVGFSHGAQLAYHYAATEGSRPPPQRHVDALVPLDFFGVYGPEQAAEQAAACTNSALGYEYVAQGFIDSDNSFQIFVGELARTAPDDTSPIDATRTNRGMMLKLVGETWRFVPITPSYQLLAPILDGEIAIGLTETTEPAAIAWLEGSPYHQAFLETVDFDAMLCGENPPVDAPLSQIRVPVLYVGAGNGVGDLGVYTTTQVSSTDVTTLVVPEFGHADLLFAADAQVLAWQPLAAWLATR